MLLLFVPGYKTIDMHINHFSRPGTGGPGGEGAEKPARPAERDPQHSPGGRGDGHRGQRQDVSTTRNVGEEMARESMQGVAVERSLREPFQLSQGEPCRFSFATQLRRKTGRRLRRRRGVAMWSCNEVRNVCG